MANKKHTMSETMTPYDDVHRTMLNDCPKLIIPVVNEMFHKRHSNHEKVTLFNNELFINRQNGNHIELISDTNFLIGSVRYHLECQSTADGTMMYRIFEYDSQIALQNSEISEGKLTVNFPNTAVLYLRHNENTPNQMKIELRVPGASCSYSIPVLKVQNYSIEEIFGKNLLFLIPFHIFSYEKHFKEYETDEYKLQELTKVYEDIINRLNEYAKKHKIDEYTKITIIDMSKKVLEHLAKKYSNVKKGVRAVMGGKILDYEAKDILNAGRAEGLAAGRAEGRAELLTNQVQKKLEKGMSADEIAEALEEDVDIIRDLITKLQK